MCRLALALPLAGLMVALSDHVPAQHLLLWNGLDNQSTVENSFVGPDLRMHAEQGVTQEFAPGVHGSALTLGPGTYWWIPTTHNLFLDGLDQLLSPDRGTIQLWFRLNRLPYPYFADHYRLFGGPLDAQQSNIELFIQSTGTTSRLHFELFGNSTLPAIVRSVEDEQLGAVIDQCFCAWIKVEALWDRDGIAGSVDTLRLYLDGDLVAASQDYGWGDTFGNSVGIGGGTGANLDRAFILDELKLYDGPRLPTTEALFFETHQGCPGSAGTPRLRAIPGDLPWLGTQFCMKLDRLPEPRVCVAFGMIGVTRQWIPKFALPLDLGIIGMPGCQLYMRPEWDILLGNHTGEVDWILPIPNDPAFAGQKFYTQALVVDPSANALGAILSNACEGRIGKI